jgi:hypothetical protein
MGKFFLTAYKAAEELVMAAEMKRCGLPRVKV